MSPTPTHHVAHSEPGQLLEELERRQDEVLVELDALDARLSEVLKGLGVTTEEQVEGEV